MQHNFDTGTNCQRTEMQWLKRRRLLHELLQEEKEEEEVKVCRRSAPWRQEK